MAESLFNFFNEELDSLRSLGARFAARYPKVAGRLRLSPDAIDDPHVARLIESFAFVAARLRLKLDDDFPELTETLLEFLYPHYLAPIPSLCVTSVQPGSEITGRHIMPRGSIVESEAVEGDSCRFRTTQAVEIWPIRVTQVAMSGQPLAAPPAPRLDAAASLRIVLECTEKDGTFTGLGIDRLRFYLRAPWRQAVALYELLLNDCVGIAFADHPEDSKAVFVGPEALRAIGFDDEDAALPPTPRGHPAFRLLTEFFAYPQKFLFFDLSRIGAKSLREAGSRLEVFFYLRRHVPDLDRGLGADTFALNCTPIINLFAQRAEPITMTRSRSEYAIVPDTRRHATREVYSIDYISIADRTGLGRVAAPLFGRPIGQDGLTLHWQLRRRREVEGDGGTDARLAIVDAAEHAESFTDSVLTAETTCTNRDLVSRLPYGGGQPILATPRNSGDSSRFIALTAFTPTLRLASDEGLLWRLLSHLKLGHLSLVDGNGGPDAFREMMRLYDYRDAPETRALVDAISSVESRRSTARVAGSGVARGLDITVEMDTRRIEPGVAFLFGQALDRFLGLYVNLNSFTRLTIRLKGVSRPLKTWPPRSGEKVLA